MASISDERKKEIIEWYLAEDERTYLDVAFEFSIALNTVGSIIGPAGVGKSPNRNTGKLGPVKDGIRMYEPSKRSGIRTVGKKASYRGHRRRA